VELMLYMFWITKEELSMPQMLIKVLTILSLLLDGDMMKKFKNNIGSLEIHGENTGEKWDMLE